MIANVFVSSWLRTPSTLTIFSSCHCWEGHSLRLLAPPSPELLGVASAVTNIVRHASHDVGIRLQGLKSVARIS